MTFQRAFFVYILANFCITIALAQDKSFELEKAIIEKITFKTWGWRTFVLPIAGYEPITRFAGGIGSLSTKRLSKDTALPVSFSEFDMVYTQNQQLLFEDEVFLYLGKQYLIKGYAGFAKYPDKFWGIGSHSQDDRLQRFDNFRYYVNMHFLRKIRQSFYAGVKYRLLGMYNIKPDATDPATLQGIRGSNGGVSSGVGYTIIWDNRDNILNGHKGMYINLAHSFFDKYTGSNFGFSRLEFDVRKFFSFGQNQVLALQTMGVSTLGKPAFPMMALLGSDSDMRGYYRGRYRDLNYLSAQAEYRLHLFWRIGVVGFAGLGDVAPRIDKFQFSDFKYSLGGGLRFLVNKKENINLRIDYAIGKNSDGLYISLGEAF